MGQVGYIKPPNNQISKLFNVLLETEKIEKERLELYGLHVLMQGSRAMGMSYSALIHGLSKSNILLDRKILSDLAINDASTFEKIVKTAVN